jgi:hypothetical protein
LISSGPNALPCGNGTIGTGDPPNDKDAFQDG